MPVDVHVVAGFLGTGKTTLLAHLMKQLQGERLGLVVNDFGQAAFDESMLEGFGEHVREIRGECVCCTAPEGFVGEVGALIAAGSLDRIFVEPTGLARPADIIDTLRRAPYAAKLALGPLIVVVDPGRVARGEVSEEVLEQAGAADVLVANRTDLATPDEMAAFQTWAASLWPGPEQLLQVSFGEVGVEVLAWRLRSKSLIDGVVSGSADHHHHDHDHGDIHGFDVRTFTWAPDVTFHRGRLLQALRSMGAERLKGVFRTDEGTVQVQVAGGHLHEAPSGRRSDSRVDVIVAHPGESTLNAAQAALADTRCTPNELQARGRLVEVALPDGRVRTFDRAALASLPDGVSDVATLIAKRSGAAARLREILAASEAPVEGEAVVVAADGYVTPPVPVSSLLPGLLVHSFEGEGLPADKGGPFRLLIPGDAGPGGPCANVKGVVRIALRG